MQAETVMKAFLIIAPLTMTAALIWCVIDASKIEKYANVSQNENKE